MNLKEKLDALVEEGWLISQVHPRLDLTIYNYSQRTQYEGYWTPETLMSRGLVLNSAGEVVARPFGKFFNLSEVADQVPGAPFEVYEKMDGSLGIAFYYKGELVFASRGSFTSEQALRGREILNKYNHEFGMYPGYTYLFEIIYPENRIVVDYGDTEELYVLGVVETATGHECEYHEMANEGFKLAKKYDFADYRSIQSLNWENCEGFVVRFRNGFRVKIKFDEYVRLHRIVTQVSNIDIWEKLKNGEDLDEILERVPDEFFQWVRDWERALKFGYVMKHKEASKYLDRLDMEFLPDRKSEALWIKANAPSEYHGILFKMLDGKDCSSLIWKMVRPEWSKPFKNEIADC